MHTTAMQLTTPTPASCRCLGHKLQPSPHLHFMTAITNSPQSPHPALTTSALHCKYESRPQNAGGCTISCFRVTLASCGCLFVKGQIVLVGRYSTACWIHGGKYFWSRSRDTPQKTATFGTMECGGSFCGCLQRSIFPCDLGMGTVFQGC